MNAHLKEAREHNAHLRQLAGQARVEADERLTQELIPEFRHFVKSLEDASAFWLRNTAKKSGKRVTRREGLKASDLPRQCPRLGAFVNIDADQACMPHFGVYGPRNISVQR